MTGINASIKTSRACAASARNNNAAARSDSPIRSTIINAVDAIVEAANTISTVARNCQVATRND